METKAIYFTEAEFEAIQEYCNQKEKVARLEKLLSTMKSKFHREKAILLALEPNAMVATIVEQIPYKDR